MSFHNVLITPHQGFFTKEALDEIAITTLKNIADFENGLPLENEVKG
jgi:D-lactate dehydrogenase